MTTSEFLQRTTELIAAGRLLYGQGMVPATSGNLFARLSDGRIAITVSGRHKGKLCEEELDAARAAGMSTTWLVRADETNAAAPHQQVSDFDKIDRG